MTQSGFASLQTETAQSFSLVQASKLPLLEIAMTTITQGPLPDGCGDEVYEFDETIDTQVNQLLGIPELGVGTLLPGFESRNPEDNMEFVKKTLV